MLFLHIFIKKKPKSKKKVYILVGQCLFIYWSSFPFIKAEQEKEKKRVNSLKSRALAARCLAVRFNLYFVKF